MLRTKSGARMSLTKSERTALRWLMAVAIVGAGVQLYRQWRHSGAVSPLATEALSRQLLAVDSAQRSSRVGRGRGATGSARRVRAAVRPESGLGPQRLGRRRPIRLPVDSASSSGGHLPRLEPVDLDRAEALVLEQLPRIGPALAARIVEDRQSRGPFGSLDGLQRVRGIGPKLAAGLRPHVTFSGTQRPSPVHR